MHTALPMEANIDCPESPFFCPREDFVTLAKSRFCRFTTLQLLRDTRDLVQTVEWEVQSATHDKAHILTKRLYLRDKILYLPTAKDPGHDITNDYIYESCRIASLIIVRVIDTSLPIIEAVKGTDLPVLIKAALKRTDIVNAWGDMNGCLFWASTVGAAAARQTSDWPYLAGVFVRLMFEMAYRNWCWAAAVSPVKKFTWLQVTCMSGRIASFASADTKAVLDHRAAQHAVHRVPPGLDPRFPFGAMPDRRLITFPPLEEEVLEWIPERHLEL